LSSRLNEEEAAGAGTARRLALIGAAYGMGSALAYTITNVLLREVASRGDLGWVSWVTSLKALPSAIAAWGLIAWRWSQGQSALTGPRTFLILCLAGLVMQLGGNIAFQNAMSVGGLALTVPLCFSTLILAGAIGGWYFLNETIPRRTMIAMVLLIAAVFLLQAGVEDAAESMQPDHSTWMVIKAVLNACLSGVSFGIGGVAIRHSVTGTGTIASTVGPIAATGVIVPTAIAVQQLGMGGLEAIPMSQHAAMLGAGVFNAVGFFAVAAAMARLPIVRVNLINASQAALCALIGVAWFHEPATIWVGVGTALTVVSLAILGTQDRHDVQETALIPEAEQAPAILAGAAEAAAAREDVTAAVMEPTQK
jgi:drug/metabolite transporter (DMT)-like permease